MDQTSDRDNPFAAPQAAARSPARAAATWTYAGFWWRVLASFIDGLVLLPCTAISLANQQWWHVAAIGHASFLVYPAYKVLMEARGTTVGKHACGIRVIDGSGHEPGLRLSLSRNLPILVSNAVSFATSILVAAALARGAEPAQAVLDPMVRVPVFAVWLFLLVDWISVAFSQRKRALHDRWAGTVCIRGRSDLDDEEAVRA